MNIETKEQLVKYLQGIQTDLAKMGLKTLIAPCDFPQGYTISLIAGESEESIVSSYVAQSLGAEMAHTSDTKDATRFAQELASQIAQRAIDIAAVNLYAVFSSATNMLLWLGQASSVEAAVRALNSATPIADTEPSDEDDFIFVVNVSRSEAEKIESLEWDSPLPELANEHVYITYKQALSFVSSKS